MGKLAAEHQRKNYIPLIPSSDECMAHDGVFAFLSTAIASQLHDENNPPGSERLHVSLSMKTAGVLFRVYNPPR